jgi:hypothetical protein
MLDIQFLSGGNIEELNIIQECTIKLNKDMNEKLLKKVHQKCIDIGCKNITTSNYLFTPNNFKDWKKYTLKSCQILKSLKKDNSFTILGCLPSFYNIEEDGEINQQFADFYYDLIEIMDNYVDKYIIELACCSLQLIKVLNILFEKTKKGIFISINPKGRINRKHIQFLCNMGYSQIETILVNSSNFDEMKSYYSKNIKTVNYWKFSFGFYCDNINHDKLEEFILNVKGNKIYLGAWSSFNIKDMKNLVNLSNNIFLIDKL